MRQKLLELPPTAAATSTSNPEAPAGTYQALWRAMSYKYMTIFLMRSPFLPNPCRRVENRQVAGLVPLRHVGGSHPFGALGFHRVVADVLAKHVRRQASTWRTAQRRLPGFPEAFGSPTCAALARLREQ